MLPENLLQIYNDHTTHLQLPSGIPITKPIIEREIMRLELAKSEQNALLQKIPPSFNYPAPLNDLPAKPDTF